MRLARRDHRTARCASNRLPSTSVSYTHLDVYKRQVPANYPGAGRRVYPGFLQHMGFVAMNPERHGTSHWDFYQDLVKGDLSSAQSHRKFYDEYNACLLYTSRCV